MNRFLHPQIVSPALLFLLLTSFTLHAADTDQTRFYAAIRVGAVAKSQHQIAPGFQGTFGGEDVIGLSIGLNFNRYVGLELATDRYEFSLNAPTGEKAAEYSVAPLLALFRLRYPLWDGRLTPYLLGGAGVGFVQVDDRFPPIDSTHLKTTDFSPVGAVGGGVEYFIANNLALGLEAKYLFQSPSLEVNGQSHKSNLDDLLWGGSLRVYFSEDTTSGVGPPIASLSDTDRVRLYLAIRTGTAIQTHSGISPQGSLSGVQGLHFIAGSLGANIGGSWGVELAVESYELNIDLPPYGRIGEYTNASIMPQLRLRYPLFDQKLVPYAVGGVGIGLAEFGDRTPASQGLTFSHSQDLSVVGAIGLGLEYFIINNVAIGLESKYRIFPAATLHINGVPYTSDLNGLLVSAGLRIFFN